MHNMSMTLQRYIDILNSHANQELTLKTLTCPFGISSSDTPSEFLLIGHVLDDLLEKMKPSQMIDCLDVATSAYELGYDPAGDFLDEAPWIMFKMSRELDEENPLQ